MATQFDPLRPGPVSRAHRVLTDLLWGLGWGCAMAAAFSLFVLVQAAADGGVAARGHGMRVGGVVGAYWAAGLGAGAVLGLLRRALGTWIGRAAVGWVCGAVVYGAVGLAKDGWTPDTAEMALVLGLLVGVPVALMVGREEPSRAPPPGGVDPPAV